MATASDSWFAFSEGSINFATCGLVTILGSIAYRNSDDLPESKETRAEDGAKARQALDMLLFYHVIDNFQTYLSDIILEVLKKDPRPMFGRKVPAEVMFTVDDLDSLKEQVIRRYITDLGYQSIDDLSATLESQFGIKSLRGKLTRLRLTRLVQTRNIIAHNRGIVNSLYLYRSKSKSDIEGERVRFFKPLCAAKYLSALVEKIDKEVVEKFKLKDLESAAHA